MALGTLIDDEGEVWFTAAPELHRRFAHSQSDFNLPAHTVCNLGFVLVRAQKSSMHVSLRPSLVAPAALAALFYHLSEAAPERVLLSYPSAGWRHEVLRSAHEAIYRVEDLVAEASAWRPSSRYLEQRHPLTLRYHSGLQRLAPMLAVWQLTAGRIPGKLTELLSTVGLLQRTVVLRNPGGTDRLIFEHRGSAFLFYQSPWNLEAIGRDMEDQPDRHYATMTARAYRSVLADDEPRFDAVDAVITTPGREVRRSRYDRLILPWRDSNGARFATGVSLLRASYVLDND